ncbi:MAG: hypothetical protein EOQ98_19515 [Mesorhizobium sp.]|uniref:hypothetical protein n=1 Tax=Mesorhizobium sp. TaxID=1871066 RepID=UPI000FEA03FC|nr:hypothetical protein [Mesorhizobium sp.]RWO97222.1 MAG: hypothetical protein EOQ98_19515 [Mesorhizobium sp.]TIM52561.1 MAG: hypothetical protein E5Y69_00635 [Mesorhizobium sp.]
MAEQKIDQNVAMAFAEIASVKLVLAAILKGVLPDDTALAGREIDAMIKEVKMIAFRGVAQGVDRATSERITKIAEEQAIRLLEQARPKVKR